MERKKLLLLILIIIFAISWGWQLKPKKTSKKKVEPFIEEKQVIGGIDLRKIEENFSDIKRKMSEFENNIKEPPKIMISKNPLKAWIVKKEPEKTVKEEKKEPEKPDFKISGIVYDKKKPYVIINDEVKEEGEKIGNFIIEKILNEKVIFKDNDGNFFVLNFEFEKGEKK